MDLPKVGSNMMPSPQAADTSSVQDNTVASTPETPPKPKRTRKKTTTTAPNQKQPIMEDLDKETKSFILNSEHIANALDEFKDNVARMNGQLDTKDEELDNAVETIKKQSSLLRDLVAQAKQGNKDVLTYLNNDDFATMKQNIQINNDLLQRFVSSGISKIHDHSQAMDLFQKTMGSFNKDYGLEDSDINQSVVDKIADKFSDLIDKTKIRFMNKNSPSADVAPDVPAPEPASNQTPDSKPKTRTEVIQERQLSIFTSIYGLLKKMLTFNQASHDEEKKKNAKVAKVHDQHGEKDYVGHGEGVLAKLLDFDVFEDPVKFFEHKLDKYFFTPITSGITKVVNKSIGFIVSSPVFIGAIVGGLASFLIPAGGTSGGGGAAIANYVLKFLGTMVGITAFARAGAMLGMPLGPFGMIAGAAMGVAIEWAGELLLKKLFGEDIFSYFGAKIDQFKFSVYKWVDSHFGGLLKKMGIEVLSKGDLVKMERSSAEAVKNNEENVKQRQEEVNSIKKQMSATTDKDELAILADKMKEASTNLNTAQKTLQAEIANHNEIKGTKSAAENNLKSTTIYDGMGKPVSIDGYKDENGNLFRKNENGDFVPYHGMSIPQQTDINRSTQFYQDPIGNRAVKDLFSMFKPDTTPKVAMLEKVRRNDEIKNQAARDAMNAFAFNSYSPSTKTTMVTVNNNNQNYTTWSPTSDPKGSYNQLIK